MNRRFLLLTVMLLVGCSAMHGCMSYSNRVVYDPPLARNVHRIVKGETTRSQIFEFFGVPYMEVRGTNVIFPDDSPMGQSQLKMLAMYNDEELRNRSRRMPRRSPYSSIDDLHVALLYVESDSRFGTGIPGLTVAEGSVLFNKLLVFINTRSGVVDEFGYSQEFKAD